MRGPEWPQPLGFAWEDEEVEVECGSCGTRLTFGLGEQDAARARRQAREHWEAHAADQYPVVYFPLPGIGDRKQRQTGTWADVISAVPYLVWSGEPAPPLPVVREVLQRGRADAGMSGGCEWPRHDLTDAEYDVLRSELVARGCLDVEAPAAVRTEGDYLDWKRNYSGSAGGSSSST